MKIEVDNILKLMNEFPKGIQSIFQTIMSRVTELSKFHTEVGELLNITHPILFKYIVSYSKLEVLKDELKNINSFRNKYSI